MDIKTATTLYAQGYYLRSDGDNRGWAGYEEEEVRHFMEVFQPLYDHGGEILSVDFMYTTGMEATAQLEIRMPDVATFNSLISRASKRGAILPRKHVQAWVADMLNEIIGESGNDIVAIACLNGAAYDAKLIISESF